MAACVVLLSAQALRAEDYPSRPIKLLVGAPAGGTTDTMARAIAEPMQAALRQPVLVENRPGAGGNIAADAVAKSAADGYTLLVSFSSHTINATLYAKLPFDPVTDFTPITMIARVPSLLVGNPKLPANDLAALIDLARKKPDTLTIGIGGLGSSLHLAGEQFKMMTGVRLLNVPYKGTAPALTDVLGGQVDLMFISLVTGTAQVHAGSLRAYGVTSAQRQASLPDVPAIGELVPGFESSAWFGVFAPADLPAAITDRLNAVIVAALKEPKLREQLAREGASAVGNTAAEFATFVGEDVKHWAPIVRQSGEKITD
jgi:tripartite-type tricarboxylate transporter receptor subunit TctC